MFDAGHTGAKRSLMVLERRKNQDASVFYKQVSQDEFVSGHNPSLGIHANNSLSPDEENPNYLFPHRKVSPGN
jgi:hypothetical protein